MHNKLKTEGLANEDYMFLDMRMRVCWIMSSTSLLSPLFAVILPQEKTSGKKFEKV